MTIKFPTKKPSFLLVLGGLFLVLFFTFQTAEISNGLSTYVTQKMVLAGEHTGVLSRDANAVTYETNLRAYNIFMRNLGHLSVYFLVTLLFQYYFYRRYNSLVKSSVMALVSTMILASLDENIQYFVPGRGREFKDWLTDLMGGSLAVVFFLLVVFTSRLIKKNKNES